MKAICILCGFMCEPKGEVVDASAPWNTFLNLFIQVIVTDLLVFVRPWPPPPLSGSNDLDYEIYLLAPRPCVGMLVGLECTLVVPM